VIPEEIVPDGAKTGEHINVKHYQGSVRVRNVAKIYISVGDLKLHKKVAIASTTER